MKDEGRKTGGVASVWMLSNFQGFGKRLSVAVEGYKKRQLVIKVNEKTSETLLSHEKKL